MKRLISDEMAAFLESGLAMVVATRDGDLRPDGTSAWAVRVHEDGIHLTLFLYEEAAERAMRNLKEHPQIAIDLDHPSTHRACQLKGEVVASRPARDDERPEIERQLEALSAILDTIGIPPAAFSGWLNWPCVAFEVRATALFEQTPGPGTGGPLAESAA